MFLIIIYYSLYYIRPTEWISYMWGAPVLMIVGVVSLCVIGIGILNLKYKHVLTGETERMMGGLVVSIILSNLFRSNFGGMVASIKTFLPTIAGFLLISALVDNRSKVKIMVGLLIVLTTFLAYQGWLQHTTGFAFGGLEPIFERNYTKEGEHALVSRIRWYGVFGDPNDLGLALILVVPFLLNMLLCRFYLVPLISLPLVMSAIYHTNSRGTVLAGLATLGTYFVIRYRSLYGVLVGAFLSVALLLLGPSRMASVSAKDGSSYGRIEAWYEAYQMFKSYPMFGVGQGMFTEYHHLTAHNSYVLVMAELGFVGLFCFTGFLYYPFSWLWSNVFKDNGLKLSSADLGLISSVFASLTGILFAIFFISRVYVLIPYMMVALVIAVTRIFSTAAQSEIVPHCLNKTHTRTHLRNIFLLTTLQVVCINLFVKILL